MTIKPVCNNFLGEGFEEYFWFRTRMDYLSSWFGALAAVLMPMTVKGWQSVQRSDPMYQCYLVWVRSVGVGVAPGDHIKYREIAPYVESLGCPLRVLRNATPYLRSRVSVAFRMARGEIVGALALQFQSADEPERRSRDFMVDTKCELARLEFDTVCVSVDARGVALPSQTPPRSRRRGTSAKPVAFALGVVHGR